MHLFWLPLLAALLPLLAVHITYWLAASTGYVEWCVPYWEGCTSISKTGRMPPASHLFKATMIPTGVVMLAYWGLTAYWLQQLGDRSRLSGRFIMGFGLLACVSLIVYATVLGSTGDFYQAMRRHGIIYFFAFTAFAQLLVTYRLWILAQQHKLSLPSTVLPAKILLMAAQIGLGLAHIPIDMMDLDEWGDAIEWSFALLMISYFFLSAWAWRASAFRIRFLVH